MFKRIPNLFSRQGLGRNALFVNTGFSELSLALSQNEDYLYVITDRNGKYEMLEMSLNNDDNVFLGCAFFERCKFKSGI